MDVDTTTSLTFLDNLRETTKESHLFLESLPVSKSILSPEIDIKSYSLYLNLMLDVTLALESEVFPLIKNEVDNLELRKKSSAIENDLNQINQSRNSRNFSFNIDANTSVGFAMGIMYVLEGSTLGGRFILKNISEKLNLDENKGASYFSGYGNKTGNFWKNFLANLTSFEAENNAEITIIEGADFAFKKIAQHLNKPEFA
ncbi:heme oxygenase [Flavobacterium sp. NST-5]|uniref:Heme oxygenase n=1 Tax=Flavobacterium ichthyis TaxID=2698827 RepID=A0ABW9Z8R8_9FLAO|nr:biliverdin-producing heme oxygenase [Flavobacterium ichthyis]NBL65301.1 heme oxygenase [Flavobacterium ichthyis]